MATNTQRVRPGGGVFWASGTVVLVFLFSLVVAAAGGLIGFSSWYGAAPLAGVYVWYRLDHRRTYVDVSEDELVERIAGRVVQTVPRRQIVALAVEPRVIPQGLPPWIAVQPGRAKAYVVHVVTASERLVPLWSLGSVPTPIAEDAPPPLPLTTGRLLAAINATPIDGEAATPIQRRMRSAPAPETPAPAAAIPADREAPGRIEFQTEIADATDGRTLIGPPRVPHGSTLRGGILAPGLGFLGMTVLVAGASAGFAALASLPIAVAGLPTLLYVVRWVRLTRGTGVRVTVEEVVSIVAGRSLGAVPLAEVERVTVELRTMPEGLPGWARGHISPGTPAHVITILATGNRALALWTLGTVQPPVTELMQGAFTDWVQRVERAIDAARPGAVGATTAQPPAPDA